MRSILEHPALTEFGECGEGCGGFVPLWQRLQLQRSTSTHRCLDNHLPSSGCFYKAAGRGQTALARLN